MNIDEITKLIGLVISLNGSLIQLLKPIQNALRWRKRAKTQLGRLGWLYELIISFPTFVFGICLCLILVLSVIGLSAGIYLWFGGSPSEWWSWSFDNAIFLTVVYGFMIPLVHTRIFSRILLVFTSRLQLTRRTKFLRHTVGWVNADWQLNHFEEFLAMIIDENVCDRFGHTLFRSLREQSQKETGAVPKPSTSDADCLADYLLICFIIMVHIERLWPYDRDVLEKCLHFLAWAQESKNAFEPKVIQEMHSNKGGFYKALRDLPDNATSEHLLLSHPLPDDHLIQLDVNAAVDALVWRFKGKGTMLALSDESHIPKRECLLKALNTFPQFSHTTYQNLFLIMSAQFRIWPEMALGDFPFSYSRGIALLFLNAQCLKIPADIMVITPDDNFRNLSVNVQEKVTAVVINLLRNSAGEEATENFFQVAFEKVCDETSDWDICDYVDQYLYNHVRQHCTKRPPGAGHKRPECCMSPVDGAKCACDAASAPWRMGDCRTFVRD